MAYGEQLLSKIIDTNDTSALIRYGIEESDFFTEVERKAYRFIRDYAEQNGGRAPDYRTVVAEVDGFTYIPEVGDSIEWLARKVKESAGKRMLHEFLTSKEVTTKFSELSPQEFADWLNSEICRSIIGTHVRTKVGTDIVSDSDRFLEEYQKRKEGRSFKIWTSKFPSINNAIGGYLSGNLYTWYGRSGRGKSVFTMEEAIEAAFQGATVLVWAMEMSWYEWAARAYSSISARLGVCEAEIDGVIQWAGFDTLDLLRGRLPDGFEETLRKFFTELNGKIPGRIIVRAADDPDFDSRRVRDLEADILATKADVVVIDPFYYVDYEKNTSKTTGGDAEATSKKLRRLAGKHGVVIHAITQADEVKDAHDDEGKRELRPPQRAEIKKTKAVLEDAVNVFGIDTVANDGLGVIYVGKGRNGGEDVRVDVLYLPKYGIVKEVETGEGAAQQFESVF